MTPLADMTASARYAELNDLSNFVTKGGAISRILLNVLQFVQKRYIHMIMTMITICPFATV